MLSPVQQITYIFKRKKHERDQWKVVTPTLIIRFVSYFWRNEWNHPPPGLLLKVCVSRVKLARSLILPPSPLWVRLVGQSVVNLQVCIFFLFLLKNATLRWPTQNGDPNEAFDMSFGIKEELLFLSRNVR